MTKVSKKESLINFNIAGRNKEDKRLARGVWRYPNMRGNLWVLSHRG